MSTVTVTDHPADDTRPIWSLDGAQLAFVSERDGELKDGALNFYVIDTAAALAGEGESAVSALDSAAPFEGDPRYSPDGRQVALMARVNGKWVAQVMDIAEDGAIIRESAQTIEAGGDLLFPVWRPSAETPDDEP
jgi:Tol biopolymer transport system component